MSTPGRDRIPHTAAPDRPPQKKKRFSLWLRRIGLAGFVFFLLKGLAWLLFGVAIVKYMSCN